MNLKDYDILKAGLTIGVVSPPGWGKSTFAAEAVRTLLGEGRSSFVMLAPGREATQYSGLDAEAEIIEETEWEPANGKYKATAMTQAMKLMAAQKRTNHRLVVVDTASTILGGYSLNAALSVYGTDDWSKLDKQKFAVWQSVSAKGIEFALTMDSVRSSGKHVIMLFHQDVKESEGFGTPTPAIVEGKTVIKWDSAKVPAINGSLRDQIAGKFDIFGFIEKTPSGKPGEWKHELRIASGKFDGAKNAIPGLKAQVIPLSWTALLEVVNKALTEGKKG